MHTGWNSRGRGFDFFFEIVPLFCNKISGFVHYYGFYYNFTSNWKHNITHLFKLSSKTVLLISKIFTKIICSQNTGCVITLATRMIRDNEQRAVKSYLSKPFSPVTSENKNMFYFLFCHIIWHLCNYFWMENKNFGTHIW